MLTQFLKLKYRTFRPRGGVQVRGVDIANCSLKRSTSFVYTERELNFSVLDCRFVPRVKAIETTAAIDPFLRCVGEKLEPAITTPNLWLFIVEDDDDRTTAMKFVETRMPEFDIMHSTYIPSKAEMLNNVSTCGTAPDVPLLFLFKRGNAYADEARQNNEGRVHNTTNVCLCCCTKTQVNPSSALNKTKHHQSNPSNVPGILDSNLSGRACIHSSKILGNLL